MDLSKIRLKDIFSPRKWAAVADATTKKLVNGVTLEKCQEVDYLSEQDPEAAVALADTMDVSVEYCQMVAYRASVCFACVQNGSCLGCGCSAPDNMYAAKNSCSEGHWQEVHSDEEWRQTRKQINNK